MEFKGEIGVQLATRPGNQYSTPDLVRLAQAAYEQGIDRVWIDDNLCYRNVFVLLSTIASKIPVGVGTAITVPYFRNPVDIADTLGTISELVMGRELSIGISRGSTGIVPHQLHTLPPIAFMRECVLLLRSLLSGNEVTIADFPQVAQYYRFKETARFKLAFKPKSPIKFYHGCSGIRAARLAGEIMDGIIISGLYLALLRANRVGEIINAAMSTAHQKQGHSSGESNFVRACEINISISKDGDKAIQSPKAHLAHVIPGSYDRLGLTDQLGISKQKVELLKEVAQKSTSVQELTDLVSDEDVKKCYIAGTPDDCREELLEVLDRTIKLGFDRISFKLGPDYKETIELIGKEIMPELVGRGSE